MQKKTKVAKMALKDMTKSGEERSGPVLHFSFDDNLGGKLLTGCNVQATAIDDVSCSWALNYHSPSCFRELGGDDKYEHVTTFLPAIFIRNLHHASVFLSKPSSFFEK